MGQRLDNATSLYLEAIRDGNAVEAINKYSGDRYTQHSTPVHDGRDGFIEFFAEFTQRNPVRDIEIVRSFEDGRYVFLHVVQNLNDGEYVYVTADIFDTDDDAKLIEHWDMITELPSANAAGGYRQIDGPTEPTDLNKTDDNKALVRGFIDDVLVGGDHAKLGDYACTETYIQHNPLLGDGPISAARSTVYTKVHNVIGCGSFVAAMSRMDFGGVDTAVIDLFRVEAGRIVEHWDVMEPITPEDTWVNSGKF